MEHPLENEISLNTVDASLEVVEIFLRKSKSPPGQFVPYAIGNKNPGNKNTTII